MYVPLTKLTGILSPTFTKDLVTILFVRKTVVGEKIPEEAKINFSSACEQKLSKFV